MLPGWTIRTHGGMRGAHFYTKLWLAYLPRVSGLCMEAYDLVLCDFLAYCSLRQRLLNNFVSTSKYKWKNGRGWVATRKNLFIL